MNNIQLIGRLTADPDRRTTQSGITVTSFTLAVDRPHVKETTDFINCVAWRQTAEFVAQYFTKGRKMGVSGILTTRRYEDKDGNKRTAVEVVVDQVDFCDSKKAATEDEYNSTVETWYEDNSTYDEDLPF